VRLRKGNEITLSRRVKKRGIDSTKSTESRGKKKKGRGGGSKKSNQKKKSQDLKKEKEKSLEGGKLGGP